MKKFLAMIVFCVATVVNCSVCFGSNESVLAEEPKTINQLSSGGIDFSFLDNANALFGDEKELEIALRNIDEVEKERIDSMPLREKISLLYIYLKLQTERFKEGISYGTEISIDNTKELLKAIDEHIRKNRALYVTASFSVCITILILYFIEHQPR